MKQKKCFLWHKKHLMILNNLNFVKNLSEKLLNSLNVVWGMMYRPGLEPKNGPGVLETLAPYFPQKHYMYMHKYIHEYLFSKLF